MLPNTTYRSFKASVRRHMLRQLGFVRKGEAGSYDEHTERATLARLLDGLVDIEQATKELNEWMVKHKNIAEFLETRPWMRESRWLARRRQAIAKARAIIRQNNLTLEDFE